MDFYLVTGNDCKSSETQLKLSFKNEKNSSNWIGMNRFFQTSETQTGRIISIVVVI